mmetsp:Transcript_4481/g.6568  ORF Transcript_4481/g.6568 Transcript_4481/m.6568 type:complete len:702 (+) Transcript_4481:164-2269(+)|eukprot:CAMPEP_0203680048 /NCGR_PEP_ID=MMETSP0090-20130426/37817_1 /ASSEMBLY_ACC=CAM_ASM_001088 /TAXON_ID=426623 /ORGANISM="Chaetoceros affinis, Strain CCMP159" /LENGTH=701 /DNA_ID=CAMNT_0050547935 /DNA_START=123 /DNA_END=2228 /DNA_ORIENTATION=-
MSNQHHLNQTYFYQNPKTNQPSASALSAKQICRILNPASSSSSSTSSSILRPDTLIIEYNQVTNQYDTTKGWVPISSIPLFSYVTSTWYYSCQEDEKKKQNHDTRNSSSGHSNSVTSTVGTEKAGVMGPISCRELASLYYQDPSIISDKTRVWSSSLSAPTEESKTETDAASSSTNAATATSWKLIFEIPLLQAAMEAFQDIVNLSFFTNAANGNGTALETSTDRENKSTKPSSASSSFQFNEQDMVYDNDDDKKIDGNDDNDDNDGNEKKQDGNGKEEHDLLLEEFFSSTGGDVDGGGGGADEDDEEEYESDGGTRYIKINGEWIDAKKIPPSVSKSLDNKKRPLAQKQQISDSGAAVGDLTKKKKKKKTTKPKFSNKHSKNWIYVTNLPTDTNEAECATYFSKVGILDIDIETQKPKIKLYRHKKEQGGGLKGDASICYAKIESVQMAIQLLDETIFRTVDPKTNQPLDYAATKKQKKICVQQAKFEEKKDVDYNALNKKKKSSISDKKRQVARTALLQAITWDEGDYNGRITGGIKGLRIIVLKNVFKLGEIEKARKKAIVNKNSQDGGDVAEDEFLQSIEGIVRQECQAFGVVEKITIFSKNVNGIVIVKFSQPTSASDAINFYNSGGHRNNKIDKNGKGHHYHKATIEASYWDGVTDYTVRDEVKEEEDAKKRHEDFGNWLDGQDLPEEFQLNVET